MSRRVQQAGVLTFNVVSSAFEKGAQWDAAISLLLTMHRGIVYPDLTSFSVTISACEAGGQ